MVMHLKHLAQNKSHIKNFINVSSNGGGGGYRNM